MFLERVAEGAPDPVFGLQGVFGADARKQKMSLMVGTYRNDQLKSVLLSVVSQTRKKLLDEFADYLPIDGSPDFTREIGALCFGEKLWKERQGSIYAAQGVGGTGALRVGADFLAQEVSRGVSIPQPTWPNHRSIFERAGFSVDPLPYYSVQRHSFDREGYLGALRVAPKGSVVLLHGSCHNPTGCDPSLEDWTEIQSICAERHLFPFFDVAYQGFGDGLEQDAAAVRMFVESGTECAVAYSCSKNFSLYCQRVGALFVVCRDPAIKARVGSQVRRIIRALYSNPPAHGALVVAAICSDPTLRQQWSSEVLQMNERIRSTRSLLWEKLAAAGQQQFSFIQNHRGMFSYLDLDRGQVHRLMEEFAVYTLDSGRINIAGLNQDNIDYFVESLVAVSS
jgi:aspartate/tyrosine/aromatic aminotransferase